MMFLAFTEFSFFFPIQNPILTTTPNLNPNPDPKPQPQPQNPTPTPNPNPKPQTPTSTLTPKPNPKLKPQPHTPNHTPKPHPRPQPLKGFYIRWRSQPHPIYIPMLGLLDKPLLRKRLRSQPHHRNVNRVRFAPLQVNLTLRFA